MKWLNRIKSYYKDKDMANKCGFEIKDICQHEPASLDLKVGDTFKTEDGEKWTYNHHVCIKCGEFYK